MNKFWALAPGCQREVAQLVARLDSISPGDRISGAVWFDDADPRDLYIATSEGLGIVAVNGLLVPELDFHGAEFATGYNMIRIAAAAAFHDPDVKKVVLLIDSPGGTAAGCFELVEWLRAMSVVADKQVVSIVKDWAASAAYALACAGDQISVPMSGAVGSIGVLRMHVDVSGMLEAEGQKVTVIHSGEHKVDGNPFEPLSRSVEKEWQEGLDDFRELFAEIVAGSRPMTVKEVLATEARLYEGPKQVRMAVDIGLADLVAPPDAALQLLTANL